MSDLAKWFEGYCALPQVVKVAGAIKSCAKACKPLGAKDEPVKEEKPEAKEDDLDDLFGDDDDDAEAAKAAAAAAKEAAKKKKKKEVVA